MHFRIFYFKYPSTNKTPTGRNSTCHLLASLGHIWLDYTKCSLERPLLSLHCDSGYKVTCNMYISENFLDNNLYSLLKSGFSTVSIITIAPSKKGE